MVSATSSSGLSATTHLPSDYDVERALLSWCLADNAAFDKVCDTVQVEHFYHRLNANIWEAVYAVASSKHPELDAVSVKSKLTEMGVDFGGLPYLVELVESTATMGSVEACAEKLRDLYRRRAGLNAFTKCQRLLEDQSSNTDDVIDTCESELHRLSANQRVDDKDLELSSILGVEFKRIVDSMENHTSTGISSGLRDLDAAMGGFHPGEVYLVGARPGAGKSSLAAQFALSAKAQGVGVLFFSIEMPRGSIACRMASVVSSINSRKILKEPRTMSSSELSSFSSAVKSLSAGKILIDDAQSLTPQNIRSRIRKTAAMWRDQDVYPGMVIVDYIQLMKAPEWVSNKASDEQRLTEISKSLCGVSKEFGVPVIALSQLNRNLESREDKRPRLSDLRGCFAGDSQVYDPVAGTMTPIKDWAGGHVLSTRDGLSLNVSRCGASFESGVKPIYRMRTRCGRVVRATGDHRFLTIDGWKQMSELTVLDQIAAPISIPEPTNVSDCSTAEARLIGYLISDGSYAKHRSVSYTKPDKVMMEEVTQIVSNLFGLRAKRKDDLTVEFRTDMAGAGKNPMINWLRLIGMHGQVNRHKKIPEHVMSANNNIVAEFLNALISGDGSVTNRAIKFTSTSFHLLKQTQALLSRFGILAWIYDEEWNSKSSMPIWNMYISDREHIVAFSESIGLTGSKAGKLSDLVKSIVAAKTRPNPRLDMFPKSLGAALTKRKAELGLSWKDIGYRFQDKNISRKHLAAVGERLDISLFKALAASPVMWDEIVSIADCGEEMTYDVSVPGDNSLVIDNLVAHNSGSLEQDATAVMLLYRDAYYNPPAELGKQEAEIIIDKNRHGETGTVNVVFDPVCTRFEDAPNY